VAPRDDALAAIEEVERALGNLRRALLVMGLDARPLRPGPSREAPRQLLVAVCSWFDVTEAELTGPGRARHVIQARHMAMLLLRDDLGRSWSEIGRVMHRDHATVMHAVAHARARVERGEWGDVPAILSLLPAQSEKGPGQPGDAALR
jgi:hypothetical protein